MARLNLVLVKLLNLIFRRIWINFLSPGLYLNENGGWTKNTFSVWSDNLDSLPFPDRSEIKNELYVRPDTGKPQATIVSSRGCPAACVYCLTPVISGKKVRFRSPENILGELRDCYHNHGISDFFFRSDTFTIDHKWVSKVCEEIKNSELNGKISWVANSRVKPLHEDTLKIMKSAGCWLVAFGFESGSDESLRLMKKGANVNDNLRAARLAKEAGVKIVWFYLIPACRGRTTPICIKQKNTYTILTLIFLELHIALPYHDTELHKIAENYGTIENSILGRDYFNTATEGTKALSARNLIEFRRSLLLMYHLRPHFILGKLLDSWRKPKVLQSYCKFGARLLLNLARS